MERLLLWNMIAEKKEQAEERKGGKIEEKETLRGRGRNGALVAVKYDRGKKWGKREKRKKKKNKREKESLLSREKNGALVALKYDRGKKWGKRGKRKKGKRKKGKRKKGKKSFCSVERRMERLLL